MRTHRFTLVPLAATALAVAGLSLQWSAVAHAGAGRSGTRAPGQPVSRPLGQDAAQVGSRLVLDSLAVPGTPTTDPAAPPPGGVTVALSSLVVPVIAPPTSSSLVSSTTAASPATHSLAIAPTTGLTPPPTGATTAPAGGVWAELRQCESGGDYSIDTGNGYYGAYQFSAGTWHGLGYPGLPNQAAPAVQDQAAQRLQARSGWGQWPACSRKLGL